MQPITAYGSKTKDFFIFILALGVAFIFYFLGRTESVRAVSGNVSKFFMFVLAPFFILAALYAASKLRGGRRSLVIDNEGITDNLTARSIGLLKWEEIDRIFYRKEGREEFLG